MLLVAVLHFLPDADNPHQIVARLRDALAPGSDPVVCHACRDASPDAMAAAETVYRSPGNPPRAGPGPAKDFAGPFDGFTLVDPGLVWMTQLLPDNPGDVPEDPEKFWFLAGVALLT